MSFTVTINYGAGDVELTNYSGDNLVYADSFKKTTELYNKDFKPVTGQAWFNFEPKPSLMSALFGLARDQEITVSIQENSTDWFTGYVRPVTQFKDSTGKQVVSMECVDAGWALHTKPTGYISRTTTDSMTVCNTSTTSQSMIHWLLTTAGFTGSVNGYTINSSIEYFLSFNKEYFEILADICFSYHAAFYFDASGDFHLYNWGAATGDVSSTATLNEADMIGELSINRESKVADTPIVKFYRLEDSLNIEMPIDAKVFVMGTSNMVTALGGVVTWGSVPYVGSQDFVTAKTITHRLEITKEYQNVSSPRMYGKYYWRFMTDVTGAWYRTSINPLKTVTLDIPGTAVNFGTANVTSSLDTGDYVSTYLFEEDLYISGSGYGAVPLIFDLKTIINGVLRKEAGEAKGPDIGPGVKIYKPLFCYSETKGKELATALSRNLEYGEFKYAWKSQQNLTFGNYYTLENNTSNTSGLARITKKTLQILPGNIEMYSYEARQYDGLGTVYDSVVDGQVPVVVPRTSPRADEPISGPELGSTTEFVPVETGLFMMSDKLGFYDATADEWTAYIQNDGDFKFSGDVNNSIEWDGSKLAVKGDMTLSGDSLLQGTITSGDGIKSSNYNAGVTGWQIDGAGDAEFGSLTIRREVLEAVMASYSAAITVGFDGTGTYDSPSEGDRRTLIDTDEISFQEYTGGAWSSFNQVTLCGADSNGYFYPFLSCRGVVNPLADKINTELLPNKDYKVYQFENNLENQDGDDDWYLTARAGFSTTQKKFGSYSFYPTIAGNTGIIRQQYSGVSGGNLSVGFWFYADAHPTTPYYISQVLQISGSDTLSIRHRSDGNIDIYVLKNTSLIKSWVDTGLSIPLNEWVYISHGYDSAEDEYVITLNSEVYNTGPLGGTWSGSSSMDVDFVSNDGLYGEHRWLDEVITSYGEFVDPDVFIQHYNHTQEWNVDYTIKDINLKTATGGAVNIIGDLNVTGESSTPPEDWHEIGATGEPAFEDSWVNYSGTLPSMAFRKHSDGTVELKGMVSSGSIGSTYSVFTLPEEYRPAQGVQMPTIASYAFASLLVRPTGVICPYTGSSTWYSLNGIRFSIDN